jgi:hypothetical protein
VSWDVILLSRDPIGAGSKGPPPLGDAEEVRTKVSRSLPAVDWSQPAWGVLDGAGWSIEFNHQAEGPTDSLMLHVRGTGDPLSAILKLCSESAWIAFDTTEGEVIDSKARRAVGWEKFQSYVQKNEKA